MESVLLNLSHGAFTDTPWKIDNSRRERQSLFSFDWNHNTEVILGQISRKQTLSVVSFASLDILKK